MIQWHFPSDLKKLITDEKQNENKVSGDSEV